MKFPSKFSLNVFFWFIYRVFRTMFKEATTVQRLSSPIGRRRLNSSGARVNTSCSSPQIARKNGRAQPSPQKSKLISSVVVTKKKKTSSPDDIERAFSSSPEPKGIPSFLEDQKQSIQEQVIIIAISILFKHQLKKIFYFDNLNLNCIGLLREKLLFLRITCF